MTKNYGIINVSDFMSRYKKGDIVKCCVTGLTDYGVFVKIDEEYSGLIHISEISNKYVSNIERLFIEGDNFEAKVLEVDDEKKQIKLTIKGNKSNRKLINGLEEKGSGFAPLKENLDKWVKEKLEELEKNAKTP